MPPAKRKRQSYKEIQGGDEHTASLSKVKKKIRDIERMLNRNPEKIEATKKQESERALHAFKLQLEQLQENQKTKQLVKKYHMVKFFERKKAQKRLKQAAKALSQASQNDKQQALDNLRECEIDWYYIFHYPRDEKYIALYAKSEETNDDGKNQDITTKKREDIKKSVAIKIEDDTYPSGLDNNGNSVVLIGNR